MWCLWINKVNNPLQKLALSESRDSSGHNEQISNIDFTNEPFQEPTTLESNMTAARHITIGTAPHMKFRARSSKSEADFLLWNKYVFFMKYTRLQFAPVLNIARICGEEPPSIPWMCGDRWPPKSILNCSLKCYILTCLCLFISLLFRINFLFNKTRSFSFNELMQTPKMQFGGGQSD